MIALSEWLRNGTLVRSRLVQSGGPTMSTEYRIEAVGSQYIVVDPWDEIVGRYASEERFGT